MRNGQIKNSVVRDNIENNRIVELSSGVREIIDSFAFQRLRNVRQMGLSSYVFPTAEHSRFAHSLGVYSTAQAAFKHLKSRAEEFEFQIGFAFNDSAERAFSIAALCHDIGHTAFSHVLESVLLPNDLLNHEECTLLILEENKEIREKIQTAEGVELDEVKLLIKGTHPNKVLCDLISGEFDVDRSDYLLRDSKNAGVSYGQFDLNWLLHAIDIEKNNSGRPITILDGSRGIDALSQFLTARKFMHRQVYFHPTVRAAQILLRGIFERIMDICQSGTKIELPNCFNFLSKARRPTLGEFLEISDVEVIYLVRNIARECEDDILKYLSTKFVRREFPKCILDTGKIPENPEKIFNMSFTKKASADELALGLFPSQERQTMEKVVEELLEYVGRELREQGAPDGAARYLVSYDPITFVSSPPIDLKFRFRSDLVSLQSLLDKSPFSNDVHGMFDEFSMHRMFVPDTVKQACQNWIVDVHGYREGQCK